MRKNIYIKLTLALIFFTCNINAMTIDYTGLELYNDPNVAFNSVVPVINGDSLIFSNGTLNDAEFFEIVLFNAGYINVYDSPIHVSVSMNLMRLTSDWDPAFTISDGSNTVGMVAADNTNGEAIGAEYTDNGYSETRISWNILANSLGFPAIGEVMDFFIDYYIEKNITTINLAYNNSTTSFTSNILDTSAALSFLFLSDNDPESYQLNSINIQTPQAVPEPNTLALMSLSLIGLGFIRKKYVKEGKEKILGHIWTPH